ncbi:hypothetical protein F8388_020387 [Cannabis sativa]|uniref:B-like cyclin n=1 Tax=Cannabis sativa TaxID=3483 RepID=A0A7J6GB51_CANSA|nr:hypothetical protein G4B88_005640 [Cannabis sativa]KAF4394562.1 hypothetical protein F8388_020387 [Cannabis sativa]
MEIDYVQSVDVDSNFIDSQLCATIASLLNSLELFQVNKRPSTDFMETVQNDVAPSMRAILIDWLVECPRSTGLYSTVNYINIYLSGNVMNRQSNMEISASKHRVFVMISYYVIPAARTTMRTLQNKPLRNRKLDIHFSIPKDNPSEKNINRGTLVVFNLDASVSNDEIRQIFGNFYPKFVNF